MQDYSPALCSGMGQLARAETRKRSYLVETCSREQCGSPAPLATQGLAGTSLLGHFLTVCQERNVGGRSRCYAVFDLRVSIQYSISMVPGHTVVSNRRFEILLQSNRIAENLQHTALIRRPCQDILACFGRRLGQDRIKRLP